MGLFSGIIKAGKAIGGAVAGVLESPVGKIASTVIPGAALVAEGAEFLFGGDEEAPMPATAGLPPPPTGLPSYAAPPAPAGGALPTTPLPANGQMPEYYQPIAGQNVTTSYRCRPGYVMVYYPKGTTSKVCMRKDAARRIGVWKPAAKPPISVKDWNHLKGADRVIKKLKGIDTKAKRIANYRSTPRRASSKQVPATYAVYEEGPGGVKLVKQGGRK